MTGLSIVLCVFLYNHYWNLRKYLYAKEHRLAYTLSQRFQLSENVRMSKLLFRGIASASIGGFISAACLLGCFQSSMGQFSVGERYFVKANQIFRKCSIFGVPYSFLHLWSLLVPTSSLHAFLCLFGKSYLWTNGSYEIDPIQTSTTHWLICKRWKERNLRSAPRLKQQCILRA